MTSSFGKIDVSVSGNTDKKHPKIVIADNKSTSSDRKKEQGFKNVQLDKLKGRNLQLELEGKLFFQTNFCVFEHCFCVFSSTAIAQVTTATVLRDASALASSASASSVLASAEAETLFLKILRHNHHQQQRRHRMKPHHPMMMMNNYQIYVTLPKKHQNH